MLLNVGMLHGMEKGHQQKPVAPLRGSWEAQTQSAQISS